MKQILYCPCSHPNFYEPPILKARLSTGELIACGLFFCVSSDLKIHGRRDGRNQRQESLIQKYKIIILP